MSLLAAPCFNWNELGYQEASGKLLDGKSHILGMAENGISYVSDDLSQGQDSCGRRLLQA